MSAGSHHCLRACRRSLRPAGGGARRLPGDSARACSCRSSGRTARARRPCCAPFSACCTPSAGAIRTPFADKPAGYVPQQKAIDPLYPGDDAPDRGDGAVSGTGLVAAARRGAEAARGRGAGAARIGGAPAQDLRRAVRRHEAEGAARARAGQRRGGVRDGRAHVGTRRRDGAGRAGGIWWRWRGTKARRCCWRITAWTRPARWPTGSAWCTTAACIWTRFRKPANGWRHRQRGRRAAPWMTRCFSLIGAFPYAIAAGLLVGVACALLGVFVILKRVVFIGIALSEIAACGIAGALLAGLPPIVRGDRVDAGRGGALGGAVRKPPHPAGRAAGRPVRRRGQPERSAGVAQRPRAARRSRRCSTAT